MLRHCSRLAAPVAGVEKVGVIGLGLMGHGIVQTAAAAGYTVRAFDASSGAVQKCQTTIDKSLSKLLEKQVTAGKLTQQQATEQKGATLGRIQPATDVSALADCDLVIEAIIEDMNVKTPLYQSLAKVVKPETIVATNTSSLSVGQMAEVFGRKDKVCGLHFFNPVQLMKLVEVIRTEDTSAETVKTATAFTKSLGKVPVQCKDTPGFVVNRLLLPYMIQAMLMYDRGDAEYKEIDIAMKLGSGHPMGPFTLADYVGLDTVKYILEGWTKNFPEEPAFAVPKCLKEKVAAGQIGRKSGQGFFKWQGDKVLE